MNTEEEELTRARAHWHRAATYSASKEEVYAGHCEAQEFEAARGKDVLEFGAGGGSDSMSYLRRGARVTFCDIVASNIMAASARIASAGLAANAVALPLQVSAPLPLKDASFDIASAHGVLHHLINPTPVLMEFHRVLKPGGKLYTMLYSEHLERRFEREIANLILAHRISRTEAFCWLTDEKGGPYARPYTDAQGRELLASCGFKVDSTVEYNRGDFRTFRSTRVEA